MKKVLDFLRGKKTTIASAIALTIFFLFKENIVSENLAMYLYSLLTLTGLGLNVATYKIFKK